MKKIILIFYVLTLLTSCEIQYDGETKIIVTGKIIDQNENPIPEKNVEVTIGGGGFLGPSSDLISYGKSDLNGIFTLVFPAPKSDNPIYISINDIINQPNEFQTKEIIAQKINFVNYKLDLDKITLYKNESITTLKLILNNTTTNKRLKNIKIEGKKPNSYINLNPLANNSDFIETSYNVIKNQNVSIKYTVIDYSSSPITSKEFTISIPIINDAVTYSISY